MRHSIHNLLPAALLGAALASAQDLAPRAYLVAPTGSNAVIFSSIWNNGKITFDPSVPIEDGKGNFQVHILSAYHSMNVLGRSANIVVSVPYGVGTFEGVVAGERLAVYRSGLADARVRLAVNLKGGRAMGVKEFLGWKERTLVGVSLTALIPNGQNDPHRAVNLGTNRLAFKPEIGFSRRRGRWVGEVYGGVWLFTANPEYYPGQSHRTQQPMGAIEAHAGYYITPRLWASLDGNFWTGGRSTVNGVAKEDLQRNSRGGATVSFPIGRHSSLKVSYSRGTYVTLGGDFRTLSAGWQYSWLKAAK